MGAIPSTTPEANKRGQGGSTARAIGSLPDQSGANLGTSGREASPVPGVYDGSAAAPRPKKKDKHADPMKHQGRGLLRVVGNDELDAAEKRSKDMSKLPDEVINDLANYI